MIRVYVFSLIKFSGYIYFIADVKFDYIASMRDGNIKEQVI